MQRVLTHPLTPYVGLVFIALSLRLYGLDWGYYHPDEWAIAAAASRLTWPDSIGQFFSSESPLNPHWFNYGSLPIYLFRLLSEAGGALRQSLPFIPSDVVIWRAASGLADAVTLALVVRIGRLLYNDTVGLTAGLLYALAVLPIQLSHYFTVDPLMTTFLTATLWASIRFVRSGSPAWGIGAAATFGLAMATKASALTFIWPLGGAWLLVAWQRQRGGRPADFALIGGGLALAGGAALLAFFIGQPYAFLDWRPFWNDVLFQARMARGAIELPYTIQYVETAPFLYHLRNIVVWGLGMPLGVAALAGAAFIATRVVRRRRPDEALVAAALFIPFLLLGWQQVKFMRYLLPLYPLLTLAASLALVWGVQALSRLPSPRARWLAPALWVSVLAPTAFYAVAFASVYSTAHPVERMGEWARANLPRDAMVVTEAWDQGFPGIERFRTAQIAPYDADDEAKLQRLAGLLEQADYLFLFSNRAYGSVSRLPQRYPLMREYYRDLFNGRLGFEIAHAEAAYPTLLGVRLADDTLGPLGFDVPSSLRAPGDAGVTLLLPSADESFTVYDHPKAILLRKTEQRTAAEIAAQLRPALSIADAPPAAEPLMMDAALAEAQREGGTWRAIFTDSGPAARFPLVVWLLAFQAVFVAGLPLTLRVFRALPDRGYLFGKVLSLLIVAYLTWLAASLRWAPFSRGSVLLAILALAMVSGLVAYRARRELAEVFRARWRTFLTAEVLFLAAFLAFALIRAANPDLWHPWRGGEKPMDLAYLIAVTKSTYMPPYDPWFAGGYLNYYYFGQFLVATLIKLTGIVPETAFNLAVPLFWALTFGGAYSISFNLAALTRSGPREGNGLRGPVLAGLASAALVTLAGNLDGMVQVVQRISDGVRAVTAVSDGSGPTLDAVLRVVTGVVTGQGFDYWRSSRMIAVPGSISITEFPFFTFLFADLHSHLLALPLTLLAVGLALALAAAVHQRRGLLSRALPLAFLALPVGALLATNAWDYPTYLMVGPVAVALALLARGSRPLVAGMAVVLILGAVGGLSYLAFLPYHHSNVAFYTEVVRSNEQTPLQSYLAIFGLPLFIVVSALAVSLWRMAAVSSAGLGRQMAAARGAVGLSAIAEGRRVWATLAIAVGGLLIVSTVAAAGYPVVAINALLVLGLGAAALAAGTSLPLRLALAAAALALALIAMVDVFAINDYLVRMNTIFRFYLQAWALLGLSAGFLLWWLASQSFSRGTGASIPKTAFLVILGTLALSAAVYPALGTRARLADRIQPLPLTLDGMAFMDSGTYRDVDDTVIELRWEREALEWLRANVDGSPVVAEAVLPPPPDDVTYFRLLSRVSVYTGLPGVVGWPWHQTQQRGVGLAEPAIRRREADVRALFDSGDPERVRRVLRTYGIRYIYVGQLERAYYTEEGLNALASLPELQVEYENPRVIIYRVTA